MVLLFSLGLGVVGVGSMGVYSYKSLRTVVVNIIFPDEAWTWSEEDFVGDLGSPFLSIQRIRDDEVL